MTEEIYSTFTLIPDDTTTDVVVKEVYNDRIRSIHHFECPDATGRYGGEFAGFDGKRYQLRTTGLFRFKYRMGERGYDEELVASFPAAPAAPDSHKQSPIEIIYTNHRGITDKRTIIPGMMWFGSTEWHPEPQWLIKAWDVEKQAERDFALKDFGLPLHQDAEPEPVTEENPMRSWYCESPDRSGVWQARIVKGRRPKESPTLRNVRIAYPYPLDRSDHEQHNLIEEALLKYHNTLWEAESRKLNGEKTPHRQAIEAVVALVQGNG